MSTYLFGVPALASLIGIIAFKEPMSIRFIGGFVAISASILLVNRKTNAKNPILVSQPRQAVGDSDIHGPTRK